MSLPLTKKRSRGLLTAGKLKNTAITLFLSINRSTIIYTVNKGCRTGVFFYNLFHSYSLSCPPICTLQLVEPHVQYAEVLVEITVLSARCLQVSQLVGGGLILPDFQKYPRKDWQYSNSKYKKNRCFRNDEWGYCQVRILQKSTMKTFLSAFFYS